MRLCEAMGIDRKLSNAQMEKREEIVLALKKRKKEFQSKYGDEWESVVYAITTKQARKMKDES